MTTITICFIEYIKIVKLQIIFHVKLNHYEKIIRYRKNKSSYTLKGQKTERSSAWSSGEKL